MGLFTQYMHLEPCVKDEDGNKPNIARFLNISSVLFPQEGNFSANPSILCWKAGVKSGELEGTGCQGRCG